MKKVSLLLVALFAMFGFMVNADAMTKDELKARLLSEASSYASNFGLSSAQAADKIETYFTENNLTDNDVNVVVAQLEVVKNAIGSETDFSKLNSDQRKVLVNAANTVSNNSNVKVKIAQDGTVEIKNFDGTTATKLSSPIKYTGASISIIAVVLSSLVVIGAASRVAKKAL